MKTLKIFRALFILVMFVCISVVAAVASKPVMTPADHLQQVIKEGIKYPEVAVRNCCTGVVDVTFSVGEDGKIIIEKTTATNDHVDRMVKDQLATICCKGISVPSYEHYKIRITFKLIG
jgi:hypothetical protein